MIKYTARHWFQMFSLEDLLVVYVPRTHYTHVLSAVILNVRTKEDTNTCGQFAVYTFLFFGQRSDFASTALERRASRTNGHPSSLFAIAALQWFHIQ